MPYRIEFTPEASGHLAGLSAHDGSLLVEKVAEQLTHHPRTQTRNRKEFQPNAIASWELRVRHIRVYYVVEDEPEPVVSIRAIGVKVRSRVWLGGEEAHFS